MVNYFVREMTAKESCKYGQYRSFEYLLFVFFVSLYACVPRTFEVSGLLFQGDYQAALDILDVQVSHGSERRGDIGK